MLPRYLLATLVLLCAPLARAESPPVLRVATSGDYAPFSRDGRGFDIEVARALARDLGARIEWVRFRWPDLARAARTGAFDIAMSGITWKPHRAVLGYLSRAVASGGPCVLYARPFGPVAVNRGGVLEPFARQRFAGHPIVTVEDNPALPRLLATGAVGAIVTDSFELPHFRRAGWPAECEPARDRKVYWVTPARAAALGPRVDAWLRDNEPQLGRWRRQWFGTEAPRGAKEHVVDLVARRLELMPAVAASKRAQDLPIEDRGREARVLRSAEQSARAQGLDATAARELFRLQIELAKRIQIRSPKTAPTLDLATELRPTLLTLGRRIVDALAECRGASVTPQDTDPWVPALQPEEREALRGALNAICTAR